MDMLLQFRNVDAIKAWGAEVEVAGRLASGPMLRFALTEQMTRDETTGRRLSNSPESNAHLALGIPVLRKRAEVALQGRYLSSRRTLSGGRSGRHAVFDLTLTSGDLWPWLDVQVGVRNLFDRDYSDPAAGEHLQDVIPQDGRTYFVSMRHRF
jgi:iron complex outermembrane receptor protein